MNVAIQIYREHHPRARALVISSIRAAIDARSGRKTSEDGLGGFADLRFSNRPK